MEIVLDVHYHSGTVEHWHARHYLAPHEQGLRSLLTLDTAVRCVMSPGEWARSTRW